MGSGRIPLTRTWWVGGLALLIGASALLLRRDREASGPAPGRSKGAVRVSKASRQEYLKDRARVNREIRLVPTPGAKTGSVDSLVIGFVESGSPFDQAGFREGDRVRRVNGTPVETMSRAVGLIHEIEHASCLQVEIERAGRLLDFQFDFE